MSLCFSTDDAIETTHLSKRIHTRVGIPKRAHKRFIKNFYDKGYTIEQIKEMKEGGLFRYLCTISKNGYTIRVYGNYILVASNSGVGVTVLNIPKEYQKGGKNNAIRFIEKDKNEVDEVHNKSSYHRPKHIKAKSRQ